VNFLVSKFALKWVNSYRYVTAAAVELLSAGLYKLRSQSTHSLKDAWFQPLRL
jgi:hypothetical protein